MNQTTLRWYNVTAHLSIQAISPEEAEKQAAIIIRTGDDTVNFDIAAWDTTKASAPEET